MKGEFHISTEDDIVVARKTARDAAEQLGFGITDTTRIVTGVSELARNIVLHADEGEMRWSSLENDKTGLEIVFEDRGPGIEDVEKALEGEYHPGSGMGRGLSGTERLMDEMEIETEIGEGTKITIRKYLK